mmetsp:Transcript_23848/g.68597  ORF Transcript_23848/g.68597 Transcript_23848/m.68597 type:complete len:580 (-) Transcript_23848:229-1968(-)
MGGLATALFRNEVHNRLRRPEEGSCEEEPAPFWPRLHPQTPCNTVAPSPRIPPSNQHTPSDSQPSTGGQPTAHHPTVVGSGTATAAQGPPAEAHVLHQLHAVVAQLDAVESTATSTTAYSTGSVSHDVDLDNVDVDYDYDCDQWSHSSATSRFSPFARGAQVSLDEVNARLRRLQVTGVGEISPVRITNTTNTTSGRPIHASTPTAPMGYRGSPQSVMPMSLPHDASSPAGIRGPPPLPSASPSPSLSYQRQSQTGRPSSRRPSFLHGHGGSSISSNPPSNPREGGGSPVHSPEDTQTAMAALQQQERSRPTQTHLGNTMAATVTFAPLPASYSSEQAASAASAGVGNEATAGGVRPPTGRRRSRRLGVGVSGGPGGVGVVGVGRPQQMVDGSPSSSASPSGSSPCPSPPHMVSTSSRAGLSTAASPHSHSHSHAHQQQQAIAGGGPSMLQLTQLSRLLLASQHPTEGDQPTSMSSTREEPSAASATSLSAGRSVQRGPKPRIRTRTATADGSPVAAAAAPVMPAAGAGGRSSGALPRPAPLPLPPRPFPAAGHPCGAFSTPVTPTYTDEEIHEMGMHP